MKLTSLLTQYLYTNQRLDLPGIGTFLLDTSVANSFENSRSRQPVLEGITFKSNPSITDAQDLIAYISTHSGKMKALATSDLESYIQLAQQFLNIGKPFVFEGIGTLVRVKPGEYEFTPVTLTGDKLRDYAPREGGKVQAKEDAGVKYESFLSEKKPSEGWRKPILALFILGGLGLAIWGGYAISKKASGKNNDVPAETETAATSITFADSMKKAADDSLAAVQQAKIEADRVNYKYILEVANSKRALKRYNQLKTNRWNVELETADSVQYKLYMLLPVLNADTTRILDSLTVMLGRKVYIEYEQN